MSKGNDSPGDRKRVYSRIAPIILSFYQEYAGQTFHMEELRRYVISRAPEIAPDSPSRILRELRLGHRLHYVVLNRRQSLYQFRNHNEPTLGNW